MNVQWWAERETLLKLPRPSLVRVSILLAAVAVGYFIFTAFGDTILSHGLTQDEQRVHDQIDRLQAQKRDLEALRDYLQTDDYVEGVARSVLGLVKAGQTLYIVNSDAASTPIPAAGEKPAAPERWWERLYGR